MILTIEELGLVALFTLAFANGANDAGKSVASLEMPGPTGAPRRKPLIWGGFFTGVGSVAAILISTRLFNVFTPQSILSSPPESTFVLAVLAGATLWILAATVARLPVSSTHAIIGAIVLQAVYFHGVSTVQWGFLLYRIVLPLGAGPIAALVGIYLLEKSTRRTRAPGKQRPRLTQAAHWMSSAASAFARGINDAPKMAALGAFFLLTTNPSEATWLPYSIVALAVLLGSMVLGHRVAITAIGRHASLDQVQRSKAGAATALVVSAGAILGAPMSTTQVHEGSSAGVGGKASVIKSSLKSMLLPWFVTLPGAGIFAIIVFYIGTTF